MSGRDPKLHARGAAVGEAPHFGERVDYLDWLRILALLGVFVFHTLRPFDNDYWHVKNGHQSQLLTDVLISIGSWGLAFFFLIAGAGTYLALRWRTGSRYVQERLLRLLIPLIVGWVLLGPVQFWLEEHHHGISDDPFLPTASRYLGDPFGELPTLLENAYHLWFVVFLLEYCLLGLPLFIWLRQSRGQRFVDRVGRFATHRGGALVLVAPVAIVTVALGSQFVGEEHGWWQWAYFFGFFLLGHLVMTDQRLTAAVRRDLVPALAMGIGGLAAIFALDAPGFFEAWDGHSWSWRYVTLFVLIAAQAWGWVLALWSLGMRFGGFRRPVPRTVGEGAMPFFLLHQPAILAVAFVVVAWSITVPVKWLAIIVASFVLTVALAWALSRLPAVSRLLGVKHRVTSHVQVKG